MIRRRLAAIFASTALILTIAISPATHASAATSTSAGGNGMRISPVRTSITINPGQVQVVPVTIQNVTSAPADLQVVVNDFTSSKDESGQPSIILDPNQYAPSHSLKRFITPIPNVSLQPNEQKTIKVTITVPKDAAGGGYYAAIRFAPASAVAQQNVTLSASVGSLILARVPGNVKDDMRLASLDVRKGNRVGVVFTDGKGLLAAVRFDNKGNVQEEPFGKIILKRGGTVLQTIEVNNIDPRGNVLPDSIRKFEISLNKVGSFGKYTLQGNFGYGTNGQLLSGETTFYVVPLSLIVTVLVALLVILFLVFGAPKLVRRYNQGVLRKAGRR